MTLIYAVLIFCLLIFVHEFGHFITAKACGVKVNEFAIGMGPALHSWERGETTYSIRIFPIGGFCAMEGEDEDSDEPRAFNNQPAWQRAIVLVAGAAMNFITCVVLLIICYMVMGAATTTIGSIDPGSPAEAAGIQSGDRIVQIEDTKINNWNEVSLAMPQTEPSTISVIVERDGQELTLESETEYSEESQRYVIGIRTEISHDAGNAVVQGIKGTGTMTVMMYKILKMLFTGEVSASDMSGPVGIIYAVNDSASHGFMNVIYLAALLSLNLAVINLLPFPALDGGRLLFLVIRKITGKRVTDELEGKIHFIGMMLLLLLMVYVTYNDVLKFIIPIFK